MDENESKTTFQDLGLSAVLCAACEKQGWITPTPIQEQAIPHALRSKDVIGLAETGSGKTGAFSLPLLQALHKKGRPGMFALILVPTRELAEQIKEQLEALDDEATCVSVVGGVEMLAQFQDICRRPNIIIATPGRLVQHLEETKGFTLEDIHYMVLDEADRMLNMDFQEEVDKILEALPDTRRNMLFSATMTSKVNKLQRALLRKPVTVEVSNKYQTVENLESFYLLSRYKDKLTYLTSILNDIATDSSMIIFCATRDSALRTAIMLRKLGFKAIPIYGKMEQSKRLAAIEKFKTGQHNILMATDVAARGLDIPDVKYVINYEIPMQPKDYIHRVGRTARAGKSGTAITLLSQYEIRALLKIEKLIGYKLTEYPHSEEKAMKLEAVVIEASRYAKSELRRLNAKTKSVKNSQKRKADSKDTDGTRKEVKLA